MADAEGRDAAADDRARGRSEVPRAELLTAKWRGALGCALLVVCVPLVGWVDPHRDGLRIQFAGTSKLMARALATARDVDGAVARDFVLIGVYGAALLLLWSVVWTPPNSTARSRRWALWAPLAAMGCDALENVCTWIANDRPTALWSASVFVLATTKWVILTLFVIALLARCIPPGRLLAVPRPSPGDVRDQHEGMMTDTFVEPEDVRMVGIACSGGGIRSAAFCLGALHGLGPTRVREANVLSAVSGGAYIAAAMTATDTGTTPASPLPFGHASPDLNRLRARSKYLFLNGDEGRIAIGRAMFAIVVNAVFLWMAMFAVLRPIGWFTSHAAVHPELRAPSVIASKADVSRPIALSDVVIGAPTVADCTGHPRSGLSLPVGLFEATSSGQPVAPTVTFTSISLTDAFGPEHGEVAGLRSSRGEILVCDGEARITKQPSVGLLVPDERV
jgi:hypothetical protein